MDVELQGQPVSLKVAWLFAVLAFAFASAIARQIRSGVNGMSICAMPNSESASSTGARTALGSASRNVS